MWLNNNQTGLVYSRNTEDEEVHWLTSSNFAQPLIVIATVQINSTLNPWNLRHTDLYYENNILQLVQLLSFSFYIECSFNTWPSRILPQFIEMYVQCERNEVQGCSNAYLTLATNRTSKYKVAASCCISAEFIYI